METENIKGASSLELISAIGFAGNFTGSLKLHPKASHLIYPLGNNIIVDNLNTHEQNFLVGHSNLVSCTTISNSGRYIASGQINFMGFKAEVIIWEFEKKARYGSHNIHRVKVEAVSVSPNDKYLASLGGQDDGCIVIWDITKKEPLCGLPASGGNSGNAYVIKYSRHREDLFLTGGSETLRVWRLDPPRRRIHPTNVKMGAIRRSIKCMEMDAKDQYFYCGTTTGDILKVSVGIENPSAACMMDTDVNPVLKYVMGKVLPKKLKNFANGYTQGITFLVLLPNELIIGTGEGLVCRVVEREVQVKVTKGSKANTKAYKTEYHLEELNKATVLGGVTSIIFLSNRKFFVGTTASQIYMFDYCDFKCQLLHTCHNNAVNDITFPKDSSMLYATCSKDDIRVWNINLGKELLRIKVPNLTCKAIQFTSDGKSIVSAWNDGKIRAFYPESGKLMYDIENAHSKGATALAITSDCKRIVSGGGEGQIRVWDITPKHQATLTCTLKDHRGAISAIKLKSNNLECVSASTDGTCIIWDLQRFLRSQVLFSNTLFMCVCYNKEECQILTSGTDRKISFWEVFDGSMIREIEGSKSGAVNAMAISASGKVFVTGGNDRYVKVWLYNESTLTHVGIGHSSTITALAISRDDRYIISVGDDGSILCWKFPNFEKTNIQNVETQTSLSLLKIIDERPKANVNSASGNCN